MIKSMEKRTENNNPSVPEIEEAVLGACLIERNALPEAMKIIRPEMFHMDIHVEIYRAAMALYGRGEAVDILTVTEELKRMDALERVGGPYYIAQLSGKLASSVHLEQHCHILRMYYLRRELIRLLAGMQAQALDPTVDLYDTIIDTQRELTRLMEDTPLQNNLHTMAEVMDVTLGEGVERMRKSVNGVTGIPTGLRDLDELTGGWQRGNVIYTAARPGDGKTALDLFFAKQAAMADVPVVYFTLERSAREVGDRWMLSECDIDPNAWKGGRLTDAELETARITTERMKQLPIHVDDTPYISIDEICLTAKSLHAKGLCRLVLVDYLQLCRVMTGGRNREQEVAECSRKLKALARRLDCPVIVSSQLNRQAESRPGQIPQINDLRESGAIEQDADIVMLLYRPKRAGIQTDKESGYATEGLGIGIIAKHRNGETGKVYYGHNRSMTKIGDYVPTAEWLMKNVRLFR